MKELILTHKSVFSFGDQDLGRVEDYVHRIGRTGRIKKKGNAVSFCSPNEVPLLKAIETYTGERIEVLSIEGDDYKETVLFSDSHEEDWRKLLELAQELDEKSTKKKNKKKKKK